MEVRNRPGPLTRRPQNTLAIKIFQLLVEIIRLHTTGESKMGIDNFLD